MLKITSEKKGRPEGRLRFLCLLAALLGSKWSLLPFMLTDRSLKFKGAVNRGKTSIAVISNYITYTGLVSSFIS